MTTGETLIRVEDFTAAYNGQVILKQLSFEVYRGEVFVILGGSGSGKSTLLKHMIGLVCAGGRHHPHRRRQCRRRWKAKSANNYYENSASCIRAARCSAR